MQQRSAVSLGESGIRTFERIADRWKLSRSERETMLGIPRSTFARLRANPERANLDRSTLERLSLVFGIYKALHVLFGDDERADTWIDRPSAAFGDRPARERMTSGLITDLAKVRQYLDVARG
jgi:putative toxin-antitoxin system antitoxin component (TIGR02293 family)